MCKGINGIVTKRVEIKSIGFSDSPGYNYTVNFDIQHKDIVHVRPSSVQLIKNATNITVDAVGAGHSEIVANVSNANVK